MPIPTWVPGEILASADVNAWFVPVAAVKSSDQSVASSTVLVNDSALFVPAAANATYAVETMAVYEGGTLGSSDIKYQWVAPSGATLRLGWPGWTNTAGNPLTGGVVSQASAQTAGTTGAGNLHSLYLNGTLVMGVTAGNLQLQWAQVVSNATATIVHAQSYVMMWRLG